jgi:hypothetical protein
MFILVGMRVTVSLDAERLARLDEQAREATLRLLAAKGKAGSVLAMLALARELRLEPVEPAAPRRRRGRVRVRDLTAEELRAGMRVVT